MSDNCVFTLPTAPLIPISADDSIVESAENGTIIYVLTRNDKFKSTLAVSNWEIENLPAGVSLGSVQRVNDAQVNRSIVLSAWLRILFYLQISVS